MPKMLRLISYDITNNKKRTRAAKILEGNARRVQYSVFETFLAEGELSELISKILPFVSSEEGDSLLVYRLCGNCSEHRNAWGSSVIDWEEPVII
ncbi:CRISPR-associated endoribonuclease Cas2 [Synergistales bacterium]|nr:CRISPR-associated endoribonuclease Cas2 [Synergistales bacterium]